MGRRRAHGEGTIVKRDDGRWMASLSLENGRRKSVYGKTQAEVRAKLDTLRRDKAQGLEPMDERQTVQQFLSDWLTSTRAVLRPDTWLRYKQFVDSHLVPALGTTRLAKLTPQQVQRLYGDKLASGLSQTTVHHLHAVLHRALQRALRLGLVQRNVTDLVEAPRIARKEMRTWTAEQARRYLVEAERDRLFALYMVALTTAMRQGELLALRWRDVFLEGHIPEDMLASAPDADPTERWDGPTLIVNATLKWNTDGTFRLSEPKTATSRRPIALSRAAVEALRTHRRRQSEERLALGEAWHDHDLVFPNTVGNPMRKSNLLEQSFRRIIRRAGVPAIRFHDLRHTAATLLLLQGIHPKVVSEILGHSSVAVTLTIYAHVLPHMHRDAMVVMDRLFADYRTG